MKHTMSQITASVWQCIACGYCARGLYQAIDHEWPELKGKIKAGSNAELDAEIYDND